MIIKNSFFNWIFNTYLKSYNIILIYNYIFDFINNFYINCGFSVQLYMLVWAYGSCGFV